MKKEYRIKKSAEIELVMKEKASVSDGSFVLYHISNAVNNHFRYAISVPKKYGSAVERNKMKRRMREIVSKSVFRDDVDFFLIAKTKSKELDFANIQKALEKLFARAKIIKDRTK